MKGGGTDDTLDQNPSKLDGSFLPPINAHKAPMIHTLSHNQIALSKVEILESPTANHMENEGP